VSYLPHSGRLDLYPESSKPLLIRLPEWLDAKDVIMNGNAGITPAVESDRHFLRVSGVKPGVRIILRFKQREVTEESIVAREKYNVTWRGDTVIRLTPSGKPYAIYTTESLSDKLPPMQIENDTYKEPNVSW
jgi:hypothetical protein